MLKSLELFGFKSFADRTRFDFAEHITCVVGPNGSGKSNVVDAIKWILGDQSAKSLRGKEMLDVIFNGSSGRKPSSFAEATLTFDNTSGLLPIDSQEVQIGRRLWRNGDSEYLINRGTARLRDVRDLFLGTGAGSAAYCIIEQGRVAQILNANSASRRNVFEEAAGISRYKARKVDAQRRLERVAQNLLRLTDIVDEVEVQLNSTRSQAAKAAKYREVSTELRQQWLGLAADDYRHYSAKLQRLAEAMQDCERSRRELNERSQELERLLESRNAEIAAIDERRQHVGQKRAANRENLAGRQSTIQHQIERRNELEADLARLRTQQLLMARRAHDVTDQLRQMTQQLEDFRRQHAARQTDLAARDREIARSAEELREAHEALEAKRQTLPQRMAQVSDSVQRVSRVQSQLESLKESQERIERKRAELSSKIAECRAECDRWNLRLEEKRVRLAALEEQRNKIDWRRQTLAGEQDQHRRSLAEQREQRSAWTARIGLLEDLEQRQEGLGIGVKEILSRAQTSHYSPWNRILGSVADLLEVDLENAALLEVALGSRTQLIVLDDLRPLLDYLQQENCQISGRVGFLSVSEETEPAQVSGDDSGAAADSPPMDDVHPLVHFRIDPDSLPDLSEQPGVLQRADHLVKRSEGGPQLATHLLADTWIVETLDIALALAAGPGRGCRFVTLQGERLDADGTLYVGTVQGETALVSRKSELRRLKNDLCRLDRKIAEEESRLSDLEDSLSNVDGELRTAGEEFEKAADEFAELKSTTAGCERELARLRQEREAIVADSHQLDDEQRALLAQLETAQVASRQADEDVRALQAEIETAERHVSELERRSQQLEQQQTVERLEFAKHQERLTALQDAYARLEEERQQRLQQQEEAERRFETTSAKRRRMELQILNTNAVLAEFYLADEQLSARAAAMKAERDRIQQQRAQLLAEQTEIRQKHSQIDERLHQYEIEDRDISHQMVTLAERIEEEYQVSLSEVVESGVSAFEEYLQKRQLRPSDAKRSQREHAAESESVSESESAEGTEGANDDSQDHEQDERVSADDGGATETDTELEIRFEDVREEIEANVNRLRRKVKMMGSVNTDSLRDLDELEQRYGQLKSQLDDLTEAKTALEDIVRRINQESKRVFIEKFQAIREHFQHLFRKLFGGGEGDVVLEDPDDVLECGIDIVARPPGKELRSISLLSGGEKTLTAVALVLAIFKTQASPFCILDEVDAALDDANIDRYASVLKEFEDTTQFIIISHRKRTMTVADVLYGVTMEQSGVSKRMSVRFEDVSEDGHFKAGATVPQDGDTTANVRDAA